jgi:ribokinase
MSRVLVAGSVNMDLVARVARQPRAGETLMGSAYAALPGGKGANQAVAAAKLGASVVMLGKMGADGFGAELRAFLQANGVDVGHLTVTREAATGVAFVIVAESGENAIVVVAGANGMLAPSDVGDIPLDHTDVALCQFETPLETTESLFRRCRAVGARTVLNCAPAVPCSRGLLDLADLLLVNETELASLLALNVSDLAAVDSVVQASRNLRTRPGQTVIATLGARGAVAVDGDRVLVIPAREVEVVDTTGAGDTFAGALAARLAAGDALDGALEWANLAASLSVQRVGAGPASPTLREVEQLRIFDRTPIV